MAGRATSKKPASKKKTTTRKSSPARSKIVRRAKAKASPKKKPAQKKLAVTKKAPARKKKTASKPTAAKKKLTAPRSKAKPKKRASRMVPSAPPRTELSADRAPVDAAIAEPDAIDEARMDAVLPASPSERVLATCAALPTERSLTDEERDAMAKVCETARRYVGADGAPPNVIESIAAFVDDVRSGRREEPKSQDVRLGLGVLWGEQLRAQVGWRWVHLTYADGFASYALVPDDRAFACFPLNRLPEALRPGSTSNRSAHVFDSIRQGTLPTRKPNAYLVIG